jgi:hypothetical protein
MLVCVFKELVKLTINKTNERFKFILFRMERRCKGLLMAVLTPVFCDSTIKTQVL